MGRLAVLFWMVAIFASAEDDSWRTNYDKGLQLIEQKQYQEALAFLKMAAADKPISQVIPERNAPLEYLPYLQMGICFYHLGKENLASEYLDLEESLHSVTQSRRGIKILEEYRIKIQIQEQATSSPEKTIREFKRRAYLLADTEVARIKNDIRVRCNLPAAEERTYPWYYHYELGLEMQKRRDWQRALDSLLSALDHREQPQKFSRIYGMWFVDYYPYYNIGLAHFHLQNWKCALDSFRLSQMMEDIPKDSATSDSLREFQLEAEQNLRESASER